MDFKYGMNREHKTLLAKV